MLIYEREGLGITNLASFIETHECGSRQVSEILNVKGCELWTISPDATVLNALKLMAEKEIGALVVVDDSDKVIGIISERDYARKIILIGKSSSETTVREIMSSPVRSVTTSNTTSECMALMTDKHIRHLPVLDNEKLIQIISIGDLVKFVISEQGYLLRQFENYITGKYPG
ncbi:MAG: CBS domain-containing protein [Pseudomonadota bacterium]